MSKSLFFTRKYAIKCHCFGMIFEKGAYISKCRKTIYHSIQNSVIYEPLSNGLHFADSLFSAGVCPMEIMVRLALVSKLPRTTRTIILRMAELITH